MLSIGGNHLIHALRRNVNLKILLFNNQIYGLTKGQYSPTSELGKVTKSTPFGSLDQPFNPLAVALGAEATLRGPHPRHGPQAHDGDVPARPTTTRARRSSRSTRTATSSTTARSRTSPAGSDRDDMLIPLEHGQPIRFGADGERGVVMGTDGQLRIVDVADVGEDAILVHDEHRDDPSLAFALSRLSTDDHCRRRSACSAPSSGPDYGTGISQQLIAAAERKGPGDLDALLRSNGTWSVG